ncbi:cysteine hydrolase family protein [Streptomyces cavernicola]|uniref:Cysteine hydrolase family protein n=1 Tax=Streptomyces cavernicola TaxID=3043613 RepID=A0ABT6SLR9_9ACTN|nr:cysteine hydrolase family protein [Streptomyces sp. B-S-A6]MDI3409135.1 cysteine hydrolase family protein [Streptomyces sp. B-S-A6]
MATTTLRELSGLDQTPAVLGDATLILVDYQNTYTRGALELTGWREALDNAAELLARARAAGSKIVHVMHDGGAGTPYDIRAEIGQIHEKVAPVEGEPVVVKGAPDSFFGTDLGEHVDAAGNKDVVVVGFMTHMCVTFTSQGAFLRGNRPTVVADACATRPLTHGARDGEVPAEQVHHSALGTVADLYGVVVPSADHLG